LKIGIQQSSVVDVFRHCTSLMYWTDALLGSQVVDSTPNLF